MLSVYELVKGVTDIIQGASILVQYWCMGVGLVWTCNKIWVRGNKK